MAVTWEWAQERLATARSYWVVTTRADGRPHTAPVWGVVVDEHVVFGTEAESVKARNVARDARAVVHLESADDVVILDGRLERLEPTAAELAAIDAPYAAKYTVDGEPFHPATSGLPDTAWLRMRPASVLAWREADFPTSRSRWRISPDGTRVEDPPPPLPAP